MQKTEGAPRGRPREDEGLFLRLAGNNLRADNMRRSCNLAAAAPMPASVTENAGSFSYTFSRARESEWGGAGDVTENGGSGVPWDNRRHHPCFPDPPVRAPHRQTLIDVIFTLDTRPSFCNLLCSRTCKFSLESHQCPFASSRYLRR